MSTFSTMIFLLSFGIAQLVNCVIIVIQSYGKHPIDYYPPIMPIVISTAIIVPTLFAILYFTEGGEINRDKYSYLIYTKNKHPEILPDITVALNDKKVTHKEYYDIFDAMSNRAEDAINLSVEQFNY